MTDANLDPMLVEGGGGPGKNRFDDQTNERYPFYFQQDIELILGSEPVLKMDYPKDKNKTRPQNRSVSDPFDQASELSSIGGHVCIDPHFDSLPIAMVVPCCIKIMHTDPEHPQ